MTYLNTLSQWVGPCAVPLALCSSCWNPCYVGILAINENSLKMPFVPLVPKELQSQPLQQLSHQKRSHFCSRNSFVRCFINKIIPNCPGDHNRKPAHYFSVSSWAAVLPHTTVFWLCRCSFGAQQLPSLQSEPLLVLLGFRLRMSMATCKTSWRELLSPVPLLHRALLPQRCAHRTHFRSFTMKWLI